MKKIQRANERSFFDHGWLKTYHSFSFAEYVDPANMNWGALRVFNDDVIAPGRGFGTHPHRDMEILTYVLDGTLAHRDSMTNERTVEPGAVQYLSAGTGITHSEYNASATDSLRLVQMWVPPRERGLHPQYGQVDYTIDERRDRWLPIASGQSGVASRITIFQDATAYVARLEGFRLTHRIARERFGFLFVADGRVSFEGDVLARGDAVRLPGDSLIDVSGDAELVLWDIPGMQTALG
ncbi:MAG TPA: pirin family protein [Candidatus Baltobacteraceae bacterium]|jgi:hypothetical protein|nr:pirin family protein [Candidatus Baltobacteraceae bacterium]